MALVGKPVKIRAGPRVVIRPTTEGGPTRFTYLDVGWEALLGTAPAGIPAVSALR